MPLVSNASNKQMNVGKMQIKGVTMATSHGSTSLGTCHTDLSVENEENKRTSPKPDLRSFEEPRGRWGWRGVGMSKRQKSSKGNSKEATRAKLQCT